MAKSVTGFVIIITVALFAGCGGSSAKNSATTRSVGAPGSVVVARSGGFSTVVPQGYRYNSESRAQFSASGPVVGNGLITNIVIVRQAVQEGDAATVARRTLRVLKRSRTAKQVSPLRSLTVAGEPALALDYLIPGTDGHLARVGLVFVRHGAWVYLPQVFASPSVYPAAFTSLEEVFRGWHWL